MNIERYVNGKRLSGSMPPLVLDEKIAELLFCQPFPLQHEQASAILKAEGCDSGKEPKWKK